MNARRPLGFTSVELLVMVVLMGIAAWMVMPHILGPKGPRKSPRIKCVNNLKNVGLAFRIFATDNNDQFPPQVFASNGVPMGRSGALRVFLTLSNELSTPMLLHCPSDANRATATNFANLTSRSLSYFASITAMETTPLAFLAGDRNLLSNGLPVRRGLFPLSTHVQSGWSTEIHNGQGNICMGDGSVQQFSAQRLKSGVADQGREVGTNWLGTNWLAVP
jgi:prepilin-type processing-associated H-X9-DG protein